MKSVFIKLTAYVLLSFFTILMVITISQYAGFDTSVGFLQFKQDYLSNNFWKTCFYIHVFTCFVCLIAGFTQFSMQLLKTNRKLHRMLGKIYVFNILFINAPAGFIMAIYANGGLFSKAAFIILDILWFAFTLKAFVYAKQRKFNVHKQFMIRSYALTLSALSLRMWKLIFVTFTTLSYDVIYRMDAWLGFGLNLVIAELIIYTMNKKTIAQKSY